MPKRRGRSFHGNWIAADEELPWDKVVQEGKSLQVSYCKRDCSSFIRRGMNDRRGITSNEGKCSFRNNEVVFTGTTTCSKERG